MAFLSDAFGFVGDFVDDVDGWIDTGIEYVSSKIKDEDVDKDGNSTGFLSASSISKAKKASAASSVSMKEGFVNTTVGRTGRTGETQSAVSVDPIAFQRDWLIKMKTFSQTERETGVK